MTRRLACLALALSLAACGAEEAAPTPAPPALAETGRFAGLPQDTAEAAHRAAMLGRIAAGAAMLEAGETYPAQLLFARARSQDWEGFAALAEPEAVAAIEAALGALVAAALDGKDIAGPHTAAEDAIRRAGPIPDAAAAAAAADAARGYASAREARRRAWHEAWGTLNAMESLGAGRGENFEALAALFGALEPPDAPPADDQIRAAADALSPAPAPAAP